MLGTCTCVLAIERTFAVLVKDRKRGEQLFLRRTVKERARDRAHITGVKPGLVQRLGYESGTPPLKRRQPVVHRAAHAGHLERPRADAQLAEKPPILFGKDTFLAFGRV